MAFLSVLLAYLLSRYTAIGSLLQCDTGMVALMNRCAGWLPQGKWAFWLVAVVPAVILGVLLWYLPFWSEFLLGLLLLLLSVGRGHWREELARVEQWLREGKTETLWLTLESEGSVDPAEGDNEQTLWLAWCRHAGRHYLDRLFAPFVWFFLLGPAGAVFYRFVQTYQVLPRVRDGQLPAQTVWLVALGWLPARYMALCACLAGNFTTGFRVWQQLLLDTSLSPSALLGRCFDAALIAENSMAPGLATDVDALWQLSLQRNAALQDLLARTEIIGLVGLALAILVLH